MLERYIFSRLDILSVYTNRFLASPSCKLVTNTLTIMTTLNFNANDHQYKSFLFLKLPLNFSLKIVVLVEILFAISIISLSCYALDLISIAG